MRKFSVDSNAEQHAELFETHLQFCEVWNHSMSSPLSCQYCISPSSSAFLLKKKHPLACGSVRLQFHTSLRCTSDLWVADWKRERKSCTYTPIRGIESGKYFWKKLMTSSPLRIFSKSSKGMNRVHVNVLSFKNKIKRNMIFHKETTT